MKLAGADFLIWLFIFAVVAIAQGWKHLQNQDGEEADGSTPPVIPKQRRPARPPHSRPAPAPASWHADEEEMDLFQRQIKRRLQQTSAVPPPLVETVNMEPPTPPVSPPATSAPSVKRLRGHNVWAARLRTPRSVRHAFVLAEILGPPKGLR